LVAGVVARVAVNDVFNVGSNTPKARWIAFFGISRFSRCTAMSVLFDTTRSR